ncbi:MAG: hypothetical protein H5T84_08155 [Thermoleophilia bacterium]|nr:hypothetical protein [Thermoleophilia bacterium]
MLPIVLLAGKFIFLIVLYLFIYRVIRSSTRELRESNSAAVKLARLGRVSRAGVGARGEAVLKASAAEEGRAAGLGERGAQQLSAGAG